MTLENCKRLLEHYEWLLTNPIDVSTKETVVYNKKEITQSAIDMRARVERKSALENVTVEQKEESTIAERAKKLFKKKK